MVQHVAPAIVKEVTQETKGKITNFFKPITKEQYLKNIKNEPIKNLIKEIETTFKKSNSKPKTIISANIEDEIQKIKDSKKVTSVQPLHVKYEGKKAGTGTNTQYLNKLRTVYKMMFNDQIDEGIINELQKLLDGKTYNQGVINHIQFFKNIDKIIKLIKDKYKKLNTLSSYINAMTSIISRVRDYFPKEYEKIV